MKLPFKFWKCDGGGGSCEQRATHTVNGGRARLCNYHYDIWLDAMVLTRAWVRAQEEKKEEERKGEFDI